MFERHAPDCTHATPSDHVIAQLERIAAAQERMAAAAEAQRDQADVIGAFILDQAKRHAAALGLELNEFPAGMCREPRN